MALTAIRRLLRRRSSIAWLLALVLWLPVAQWAAASHALLHLSGTAADGSERPAHLPGSCGTCIVAAAIGGAAPQSPPAITFLPAPGHALPHPPLPPGAVLLFAAPYRSRAPPSLPA
jgi:hypothetical protein